MEIKINKNDVYIYYNKKKERKIYGSLNGKFKIGDRVQVLNIGEVYSLYKEMANAMKIPLDKWGKYNLYNGDIGIVIARKIHAFDRCLLYGVKFNDVYIIGEDGLKLVEKGRYIKKFKNEDFKI